MGRYSIPSAIRSMFQRRLELDLRQRDHFPLKLLAATR